jgi:Protein of unknown function, DUF488
MELHTSSYRTWRPGMGFPVVASLLVPKWLPEAAEWPRCWVVTPQWSYWRAEWPEPFREHYVAQLDRHGPRKIARVLERIAREHQAPRLTLLCHEIRWEECHRHLFACWLLERTGELVTEIT